MIKRDEDRVLAIERLVADGKVPDLSDLTWLCRRFRGLAMAHLDEYDFPEYLAIAGRGNEKAISLRLLRVPSIRAVGRIAADKRDVQVKVFSYSWICAPVELLGVIRPWIRTEKKEDVEFLKRCTVDLHAAGEVLLRETSAAPYLMDQDGIGVNTALPVPLDTAAGWRLLELDDTYLTALPNRRLGVGLLGGDSIDFYLRSEIGWPDHEIRVECGLTAAHYTSARHDGSTMADADLLKKG